jgi:ATP-dependent NAD(P)H-hydrate dehydratase
MGRIAVIGGSEDYTGAPYFSAMASARLGADMVIPPSPSSAHILTPPSPISSASPKPHK